MDNPNSSTLILQETVSYFLKNKEKTNKQLDKVILRNTLVKIENESITNGLPIKIIQSLAEKVVFANCYDGVTRKRLLYCLVPCGREFPYSIVPLALSNAMLTGSTNPWKSGILSWLNSLLTYKIIDSNHSLVHICYPGLFLLLKQNYDVSRLASSILCQLTRREDVTMYRTKILRELTEKIDYTKQISPLLSLYQIFRPDLVVYRLNTRNKVCGTPDKLKESLTNAVERFENELETTSQRVDTTLWPEAKRFKQLNVHHVPTVIPYPEIYVYAETLEKKKEKLISVLQYRNLNSMIQNLRLWKEWRWPNCDAALLRRPALIAFFRCDDARMKVSITNWLETALRTEILEEVGNPSQVRQESLFDACINLVHYTETIVPVVFNFLIEFMVEWDGISHFEKVLKLVSFMPFTSPFLFFDVIFPKFCEILSTVSIGSWSNIINVFSEMTESWLIQAHDEINGDATKYKNSWNEMESSPLQGVIFLSKKLEVVFESAFLRFGPMPLIINACLSYYEDINRICEKSLDLPLFVTPTPQMFLFILSRGDLVGSHRIGLMLISLVNNAKRLDSFESESVTLTMIQKISLFNVDRINMCIKLCFDVCINSKAYSNSWTRILEAHVGEKSLNFAREFQNINGYGSLQRCLTYSPLVKEDIDTNQLNNISPNEDIFDALEQKHLSGMKKCKEVLMKK